ncbi:Histidine phosphatase superfamily (branch 1) [Roseovarius litoreus]|uniref:Histidine phosphatase superfamily (Branch 1) n=1 Tax=Roseovarius litoreus TaxID=1155722 RepID=A0A1M7H654_9RHOB|nr:histidine phosphatase family protein [Roseovarius litoreus]SHM23826.1 Histidine phosphatase superfamily (branch 1) [Roseovarius litoreus]
MRFLLLVAMLCLPLGAMAQDMSMLKQPGVVALMRHALAPGTGDPANFEIGDCSTQRNLDARGRDQARRAGEAMRAAGVSFDHIWTSQWCRARETAELLEIGEVVEQPPLNSFFQGRGDRAAQTARTQEMIDALPQGARVLLVGHFVNISALTGVGPSSGEIIVTRRDGRGGLEVVGRIETAP